MLSIIAAVALNNCIGKGGALPWHIPADLKRFKELTWGKTVIMGAKTYLSLKKPLAGRKSIVLTRDISGYESTDGVIFCTNPACAFNEYKNHTDEAFVIGGGGIYEAALPYCEKLYITQVLAEFDGDTFFPNIDLRRFGIVSISDTYTDETSGVSFCYMFYNNL